MSDKDLGQGKSCLIIGPIGSKLAPPGEDSKTIYEDSIQLWETVFLPATAEFAFSNVIRADKISQQGEIPEQIFLLLRDVDVVVADLTKGNPNVMYELGLRHTRAKLTIPIGEYGRLPFDVNTIRTIQFTRTEGGLVDLRRALVDALREGLSNPALPVTATRVWLDANDVNAVADFAAAAISSVAGTAIDDSRAPEKSVEEPGLIDLMAEGEAAIEELGGVLETATEILNEVAEIQNAATAEVARSDEGGRGFAGRLRIANQSAEAMKPLADRYEVTSSEYVRLLNLADPAVRHVVNSIARGENTAVDARDYLISVVELADVTADGYEALAGYRRSVVDMGSISVSLKPVARQLERAVLRFQSGQKIILEWRRLIVQLPDWDDKWPTSNEGT